MSVTPHVGLLPPFSDRILCCFLLVDRCSYKYLNSGPGSISGVYLHEMHHSSERAKQLPKLAGWWGQDTKTRFVMSGVHQPKVGAQSYMLSNPAVLPTVCLVASLEVYAEAGGVSALRKKSIQLTVIAADIMRYQALSKHVLWVVRCDMSRVTELFGIAFEGRIRTEGMGFGGHSLNTNRSGCARLSVIAAVINPGSSRQRSIGGGGHNL